jgi:hypothetical protein
LWNTGKCRSWPSPPGVNVEFVRWTVLQKIFVRVRNFIADGDACDGRGQAGPVARGQSEIVAAAAEKQSGQNRTWMKKKFSTSQCGGDVVFRFLRSMCLTHSSMPAIVRLNFPIGSPERQSPPHWTTMAVGANASTTEVKVLNKIAEVLEP